MTTDPESSTFSFFKPGVGIIEPGGQLVIKSDHGTGKPGSSSSLDDTSALDISYQGSGTLDAKVTVDPLTGEGVPSGTSTPITLRIQVTIDAGQLAATAEVWAGKDHYSANSHGHPPDADATVRKLIDVLKREDWGGLYDLMASSVRNAISRQQFIAQITASDHGKPISITAQSPVSYSSAVFPEAQIALVITYQDNSGAKVTTQPVAIFTWEQNGWYLLDMREVGASPPPASSAT